VIQRGAFYLDVHPVWVGMGSNLLVLGLVSLWDFQGSAWTCGRSGSSHRIAGALSLTTGIIAVAAGLVWFAPLHQSGLVGLVFFVGVTGLTAGQFLLVRPPYEDGTVQAVAAAD
jgi:SSS family solute:Na+ symporter